MDTILATPLSATAFTPVHWLLGATSSQRRAVKRLLLRIAIYAAVWALMLLVVLWGFARQTDVLAR